MNSCSINQQHRLKSSKRNITLGSIILLILSIVYFFIGYNFYYDQLTWIWIVIVVLYVSAGVLGLLGTHTEQRDYIKAYERIIQVMAGVSLAICGYFLFMFFKMAFDPEVCSTRENESCEEVKSVITIVGIFAAVGSVVSAESVILLFVLIRHSRKYIYDIDLYKSDHKS